MNNQEIETYVSKAKSEGMSIDTIKTNLLTAGWGAADVEMAIQKTQTSIPVPIPPVPVPHPKTYSGSMWDSFEHILMFISMYVLSVSLALLLNQYIDMFIPSATLTGNFSYTGGDLLRGYMASLIVSLPLFSYFFLRITKNTKAHPELRNLGSRKFLIYATLVITFIIVLFSVVRAVFDLLSGNVTFNFVLHFLVTVGISSLIFIYYLGQVRDQKSN